MFKVSVQLNANESADTSCVFGKFKAVDNDSYKINNDEKIFVAPELTDTNKINIIHFPQHPIRTNTDIDFVIKKNGVRGNIELKLQTPSGNFNSIPLQIIDPDRMGVRLNPKQEGLYKVHIKCNSVDLPGSPYIMVVQDNIEDVKSETKLPVFQSDASKVIHHGNGLKNIQLNAKNDFIVDASNAGNNILLIGVCGPKGQCDEVTIRHMGKNVYNVIYQVEDPGEYVIAAKWGDDYITGSPFHLETV